MDESRAREERMTQMLHDMQLKLSATETQQELLPKKTQKDQLDLQQANVRLEGSLHDAAAVTDELRSSATPRRGL